MRNTIGGKKKNKRRGYVIIRSTSNKSAVVATNPAKNKPVAKTKLEIKQALLIKKQRAARILRKKIAVLKEEEENNLKIEKWQEIVKWPFKVGDIIYKTPKVKLLVVSEAVAKFSTLWRSWRRVPSFHWQVKVVEFTKGKPKLVKQKKVSFKLEQVVQFLINQ